MGYRIVEGPDHLENMPKDIVQHVTEQTRSDIRQIGATIPPWSVQKDTGIILGPQDNNASLFAHETGNPSSIRGNIFKALRLARKC
jgi:hypothetical protein